ncbi:MAG TPA: sigma-70 family RNA polymerase sigma factor [Polyangiales bacterium]|nr:sigma-70 family RNA polymerase sigma factor [Polyangiales bacterium]
MDDMSDAELVECIAEAGPRREAAEAALCRRFAPRIRLYGIKHLRDEDLTRDLTQTVLVAVLEAARQRRIDDPQHFDRFVFGTCRNTVARMRQQATRLPLATDEKLAALVAVPPLTVELNGLFACIAKLEERSSLVLMMSFLEERSAAEIATKLSLETGNVRVIRHRALGALRRCLDAGEGTSH